MPSIPTDFISEMSRHITEAGSGDWIDVYSQFEDQTDNLGSAAILLPNNRAKEALASPNWGLYGPRKLSPGCTKYSNEEIVYHRFGNGQGYEPIVLPRNFHGIRPEHQEVSEEFRLFHNLYLDKKKEKYVKIKDDGNELDVIRLTEDRISIRAVEMRQFLAIKEMQLALLFDLRRRFPRQLAEFHLAQASEFKTGSNFCYICAMADNSLRKGSLVRVLGKKLIEGYSKEDSDFWPYNEIEDTDRTFLEFIVGLDERGREVSLPCHSDGDNYLTPVHFRAEVLNRYYDNPGKYSVEDGYLRCASLWGVRIDNDNEDYVTVFLGDIGRDIPESEHGYWRSFNIPPKGGMSWTAFRRNILAEFVDASREDLLFKRNYTELNRAWKPKFGWELFKPLSEADLHCFASLRIPATDEHNEFDTQVMFLTKVLVDSLNESELSKHITSAPNQKGISKLDAFLERKGIARREECIEFLRDLQSLRSEGSAHRKSKNYEKTASKVGLTEKDPRDVFREILTKAVELLAVLNSI
ncbi:MAG: hypothetical protein ABSG51_09975 [Terracidiphilus sp.]